MKGQIGPLFPLVGVDQNQKMNIQIINNGEERNLLVRQDQEIGTRVHYLGVYGVDLFI